jgi:hypothetical protein
VVYDSDEISDFNTPYCIRHFNVLDGILVNRWVPKENRDNKQQENVNI